MPAKPSRYCPKCKTVHDKECPKSNWKNRKNNGSYGQGRGGRPWRRKRKAVMERDLYLCQMCRSNNVLTSVDLHGPNAGICDHRIPKCEGGTDDDSNLQTLCKKCSEIKTLQESQRGRGG